MSNNAFETELLRFRSSICSILTQQLNSLELLWRLMHLFLNSEHPSLEKNTVFIQLTLNLFKPPDDSIETKF